MRRELAIKVEYLSAAGFDRVKSRSAQWLREPWALDEDEKPFTATVTFPGPGHRRLRGPRLPVGTERLRHVPGSTGHRGVAPGHQARLG